MSIIIKISTELTKKDVTGFSENPITLLSNKRGSYFSISNNQTSYQGLTIFRKNNMYKIIDSINLQDNIEEIKNYKHKFIIKRSNTIEEYQLTETLKYNIKNYNKEITIDLDFRFLYNNPELGRIYNIRKENNLIIIEYNKYKTEKLNHIQDKYYALIKIDNLQENSLKIDDNWIKKYYEINKKRNENPSYYVNRAIRFKLNNSGSIIISFADNIHKAKEKIRLSEIHPERDNDEPKLIDTKYYTELEALYHSLDQNIHQILLNNKHQVKQIFAGWPWFFQFWTRDSLISLGSLILTKRYGLVKKILSQYLNLENKKGLINSRIPSSELKSIDSTGWLFKRYYDFLYSISKNNKLNDFYSKKDLKELKSRLESIFDDFIRNNMRSGLIYSGKNETWMDTDYGDTGRTGFCIEIQALTLSMVKTIRLLSLLTNTKTIKRHRDIETKLLLNVRKKFYRKGLIADHISENNKDFTQRPNIYLARYVYPHLFSKKEWETAFSNNLKKLWLDWGGLTTIDKEHETFTPNHTGKNNKSYHRGDSWYFINNIAAMQLFDVNKKKYATKIRAIFNSSTKDLFFTGVIGGCAEISSASHQTSEGCLNQSWSSATLIELLYLLENKNMFFD